MIRNKSTESFHLLLLLLVLASSIIINGDKEKSFYIVYMGDRPNAREQGVQSHINILSTVKGSSSAAEDSIVHSYTSSFSAFAAKLTADEAQQLSSMDRVISVFPNRYHKLSTTKSWDFIGFPLTVKRKLKIESDIIVGLLDTGITPDSESFNDKGFGPPPEKWKGTCRRYVKFSGCNNKIIGARYFKLDGTRDPYDILSPIDVDGHGTHTSSTLAGNLVKDASLYGLAKGIARGAVPSARIAVYKVCWESSGCADMDLLAAFDTAIADGVDIISISIGSGIVGYLNDSIAIGTFHAMKKGILTSASAGNGGPTPGTVENHAPWILTVGASGTNRQFRSKVMLGNGKTFSGIGVNNFSPERKLYPLVVGANASNDSSDTASSARYCIEGSLDSSKVKGKLVYCEMLMWGVDSAVKLASGVGTVVESDANPDTAQIFMTPGTVVDSKTGKAVTDYINSTRSPSAVIYRTQEVNVPAPFVASFSSRGPNPASIHILKPDIVAPGIDILASYTLLKSLTGFEGDNQYSKFTIMSGTSMACPHVAGVAAYIKSFHPKWSPAAIKSAIITTAKQLSPRVNNDAEFAYGSGQVNPARAIHPGLVYDMDQLSYIQFLCREGYKGSSLGFLVGSKHVNCSSLPPSKGSDGLNYPTMQLPTSMNRSYTTGVFRRRVTNVGPAESVYNATIRAPKGVVITVRPETLSFTHKIKQRSFIVMVKAKRIPNMQMRSGELVWRCSHYAVRSSIVIYGP
ncbi:subtilisin-like protease SBT4.14 [Macadamia integrifolia]|uniref:subtilisin-like protease SBT4.14 n=1 Tax=Macadamia integrifolia TaxID=60698 RepID=UPI001C4F2E05|nr:subtilisin-like protease SBT4.14 [Macadamia integrifolia]